MTNPYFYPGKMLKTISNGLASMTGDLEIQVTSNGRKRLAAEIVADGYHDGYKLVFGDGEATKPFNDDYAGTLSGVGIRVVPEWEPGAMIRVVVKGEA